MGYAGVDRRVRLGRCAIRACALGAVALVAAAIGAPSASAGELVGASGPSDPDGPRIETATNARRVFYSADKRIEFYYRVSDDKPVDVEIDLIKESTGTTIKTWSVSDVKSDEIQSVAWSGVIDGDLKNDGRYRFRMVAEGSEGARTASADRDDDDRDAFKFYRNYFPVRGPHSYGDGLGAGRGHQGQDVFADCGTDLVAARGGKVQAKRYHDAAGYYLVIDGRRTDRDYAYMHLRKPSPRSVGERVRTGQRIGSVGESGNASGCHLHFELWSGPGWYEGGSPVDPTGPLKYWDSYS